MIYLHSAQLTEQCTKNVLLLLSYRFAFCSPVVLLPVTYIASSNWSKERELGRLDLVFKPTFWKTDSLCLLEILFHVALKQILNMKTIPLPDNLTPLPHVFPNMSHSVIFVLLQLCLLQLFQETCSTIFTSFSFSYVVLGLLKLFFPSMYARYLTKLLEMILKYRRHCLFCLPQVLSDPQFCF